MNSPDTGTDVTRRQAIVSLGSTFVALALMAPPGSLVLAAAANAPAAAPPPAGPPMKIGIIGTGRIGGSLARHWAKAGHELMISSRHPDELKPLAAELGARVHVGTPQEAAAFGEVILVATPNTALAQIGTDFAKELAGKVILDTSNSLARAPAGSAAPKVLGVADAELLKTRRLVRAFNCINSYAVTTDAFRPGSRRAIPIAGDDPAALEVARRLVYDAGFDAFVVGSLERSKDFELYEILAQRDWNAGEFKRAVDKLEAAAAPAPR